MNVEVAEWLLPELLDTPAPFPAPGVVVVVGVRRHR